tara:strand:- start:205 stop:786 length:582 start_codon:yes stop_codon:yes gene_type:complete
MIDAILACPWALTTTQLLTLSTAVSAAGALTSYSSQKKAANEQRAYQNHLADLQKKAGQRRASATVAKNIQDREALARQRFAASQKGEKLQAMATLSAGEAGVSGLSIDSLIDEYSAQQASYMHGIDQEEAMRSRETGRVLGDIALGTQQQVASTLAPVRDPNAFAHALQFGTKMTDIGMKYKTKGNEIIPRA